MTVTSSVGSDIHTIYADKSLALVLAHIGRASQIMIFQVLISAKYGSISKSLAQSMYNLMTFEKKVLLTRNYNVVDTGH